jgi:glycosyltransferase 2 family protein
VLLVLIDRALMAYRSVALLCTIEADRRPPIGPLMRIFFVSTFLGTFLPASVGGDLVRSYSLAKLNVDGGDAVASVLMDRVLGVAAVLAMALVGLTLAPSLSRNPTILAGLALAGALCVVVIAAVFSRAAARLAAALASRMPIGAVRRAASRVLDSVRKYSAYPRQLAAVLAGSIGVQVLRIVQAYYLGRGLGIDASPLVYFAFIPLILLVMLLPVTFNGIGTGQAAFVWFFAQAGVPAASAFTLSVLFIALGIIGNLPGAILYLTGPPKGGHYARGVHT